MPTLSDVKKKPILLVQVVADLVRHEGYRKYAYPDPLSILGKKYPKHDWGRKPAREILALIGQPPEKGAPWTVGIGYTHGVNPDTVYTLEMAMHKCEEEVVSLVPGLSRIFSDWINQPFAVQTVLLNMAYNMGIKRLSEFKNTFKYLLARDYDAAGTNLKKSLWYKQVGDRADELIKRVRTQSIDPQHLVEEP
jgi:GH24 family phage-related lysozyme (muramidase)